MKKNKMLISQILIATSIYLIFWDSTLFSPIRIFFVTIHEACHGFATLITGGNIVSMSLNGHEGSLVSAGGFFPFISSFGYIGSAIIGSFLMATETKKIGITILNVFLIYLLVRYIDSYFSLEFIISLSTILFLTYVIIKKENIGTFLSGLIGTLLAFESLEDVKNYLIHIPTETDAGILAKYFGSEFLTLPISISFLLISLFIWSFGVKKALKN